MREDVLGLEAMAGDRVSQEYLKADLYHRAQALRDIPDVPLFFGRLDYAEGAVMNPGTFRAETGLLETAGSGDGGGDGRTGRGGRCRASGCTSGAATSTIATATRPSSTGARRCPGPSTGPARPTPWA